MSHEASLQTPLGSLQRSQAPLAGFHARQEKREGLGEKGRQGKGGRNEKGVKGEVGGIAFLLGIDAPGNGHAL